MSGIEPEGPRTEDSRAFEEARHELSKRELKSPLTQASRAAQIGSLVFAVSIAVAVSRVMDRWYVTLIACLIVVLSILRVWFDSRADDDP